MIYGSSIYRVYPCKFSYFGVEATSVHSYECTDNFIRPYDFLDTPSSFLFGSPLKPDLLQYICIILLMSNIDLRRFGNGLLLNINGMILIYNYKTVIAVSVHNWYTIQLFHQISTGS